MDRTNDEERRLTMQLEASYLERLRSWDEMHIERGEDCNVPCDHFENRPSNTQHSRVKKARQAKLLTNQAVAAAVVESARRTGTPIGDAKMLVLDGAEGHTTAALEARGIQACQVLSPNRVPAIAEHLRKRGVCAWAGRIEDYLDAPVVRPLQLVYLDHNGALAPRAGQIEQVLARGFLLQGGVLACTFSTREGGWARRVAEVPPYQGHLGGAAPPCSDEMPTGWSAAHAIYALVSLILRAAGGRGLAVEGADIAGLDDYQYRPWDAPAVEPPAGVPSLEVSLEAVRGALAEGRLGDLAERLAARAAEAAAGGGPGNGCPPAGAAAGAAHRAGIIACRALAALRLPLGPAPAAVAPTRLLGAAWTPQASWPGERGKPHAVLGAGGALADDAAMSLRSAAHRLLGGVVGVDAMDGAGGGLRGGVDEAEGKSPTRSDPNVLTLKRCLLLYPEQMMFLILRVVRKPGDDI